MAAWCLGYAWVGKTSFDLSRSRDYVFLSNAGIPPVQQRSQIQRRRTMIRIISLSLLTLLAGCLPILHEGISPVPPSKDPSFHGINETLQQPGDKRVVLLIVHGMGNQTLDYADKTIGDLTGELRLADSRAS